MPWRRYAANRFLTLVAVEDGALRTTALGTLSSAAAAAVPHRSSLPRRYFWPPFTPGPA